MRDGSASGAGKGDKMKERVNAKQIFLELIVIVTAVLSIYAVYREEIPRIVGDAFGGFLLVALLVASFERYPVSKLTYGIAVIPVCYSLIYPFLAHNRATFAVSIACTVIIVGMAVYAKYVNWEPKDKDSPR